MSTQETSPPDDTAVENSPISTTPLKKLGRWIKQKKLGEAEVLALHRRRDAEDNERDRLPADEDMQTAAIWITELYLPSALDSLVTGLSRLGWRHGRTRHQDLMEWLQGSRHQPGGGWISLGLVSSPKDRHFMSERVAEMPAGVSGMFPVLHSLNAGITALTIMFVLEDEQAGKLGQMLRSDYETQLEVLPPWTGDVRGVKRWWRLATRPRRPAWRAGFSIHDATRRREQAVADQLSYQRTSCGEWIKRLLPGTLSLNFPDDELPAAQLLLTEKLNPTNPDSTDEQVLHTLGIARGWNYWKTDEWPSVRISLSDRTWTRSSSLAFMCRRADAFDSKYVDSTSNWSLSQGADDHVRGLLLRWSLSIMLDRFRHRLTHMRDQRASSGRKYRPFRDLRELRKLLDSQAVDIDVVAYETKWLTNPENERLYKRHVLEPVEVIPEEWNDKREPRRMLDDLRNAQAEQANRLSDELKQFVATSSASVNVTAVLANYRLQWLVALLAVVAIVVSIVGAA